MITQYYYTTVREPGTNRRVFLTGPHASMAEATQNVYRARRKFAKKYGPSSIQYGFGTAGSHLSLKTLFGV